MPNTRLSTHKSAATCRVVKLPFARFQDLVSKVMHCDTPVPEHTHEVSPCDALEDRTRLTSQGKGFISDVARAMM